MTTGDATIAWPAFLTRAEASIVRRPHGAGGIATLVAMTAALVLTVPQLRPFWTVPSRAASDATRSIAMQRPIVVAAPVAPAPPNASAVSGAPIHLTGTVTVTGTGTLYRSLVEAGATPSVAAAYIGAIDTRFDVGTITTGDRFDLVVAYGGQLLYAGIVHSGQPLGLMRWTLGGREQWLDAAGTGAPSDGFIVPVADARLSSGFGMRFHPILGFSRMHQGIDLAAPLGTPIMAAAEGIVRFAGGHGGYGNFVQVQHDGGMGSGYGHMSAIVVRPGEMVRQGQLLGYVGSTGLSTGPHCHFEIYREGVAIDPTTANYAVEAQLGGEELAQFRLALTRVTAIPVSR